MFIVNVARRPNRLYWPMSQAAERIPTDSMARRPPLKLAASGGGWMRENRLSSVLPGVVGTLVVLVVASTACQGGDILNETPGVVVTVVDSGPSLRTARTFVLPDTIVELPAGSQTISHAEDQRITASIRSHLVGLGWRDIGSVSQTRPDVIVLVAASTRIQTGVTYTDWFGAWGYLPYWGAGVGSSWAWGAPAGAIPYVYEAGTLLVTMLDLRGENAALGSIPLLWAAAVDGVVSGPAVTAERALEGIDQAFAQSAYLQVP